MYIIHCLRQIADGLAAKNLARSKLPAKLGFNEKIECLQRLEERYYKDKSSDKQVRSDYFLQFFCYYLILSFLLNTYYCLI